MCRPIDTAESKTCSILVANTRTFIGSLLIALFLLSCLLKVSFVSFKTVFGCSILPFLNHTLVDRDFYTFFSFCSLMFVCFMFLILS